MPQPSGSVLFMDSPDSDELATKWDSVTAVSTSAELTPSGGASWRIAHNGNAAILKGVPATSSVLCAWYARHDAFNSGARTFQVFGDGGGTAHITLNMTTGGAIVVRLGSNGTTLDTSDAGVISLDTWHHWQARVTVDDSTGRVEVWIDGTQVIDFTGDTKSGGTNATIDAARWGWSGSTSDVADLVICDSTTPIGVCRVASLLPNAVGNSSGLTPSGGAVDNYTMVDETDPDDDTSYVSSATEGDKDTYGMEDTPSGTFDVLAVQVSLYAKASDAGPKFVRPVLRIGTTDHVGTSQQLPTSYDSVLEVFDDSPSTAVAFTTAEVDAMEVGVEVRDS